MKKILIIYFLLLLNASYGYAQLMLENTQSNFAVYGEISFSVLANSSFSMNVETKLLSTESQYFHVYLRGGVGYLDRKLVFDDSDESALIGQFGGVFLLGEDDAFFELYVGYIVGSFKEITSTDGTSKVLPTIDLGFRYQEPGNNTFFRLKVGLYGVGGGVGYSF